MIPYVGRFGAIRHLLAELREDTADVLLGERTGRLERCLERFTRHEATHGPLKEPSLAQLPREPLTARSLEEDAACDAHGKIV